MSGVLVVAEHLRGSVKELTAELVAAGVALKEAGAGPVAVALVARDPAALVGAVSLAGVDEIVEVGVDVDEFDADVWTEAVTALVREREPTVVLGGHTVNGMTFGPALAVRLGLGFASDIVACELEQGKLVARRSFYGGKVAAELEFAVSRAILLLRAATWAAAEPGGAPAVTTFEPVIDPQRVRTRHLEFIDLPVDDLDITTADVILAIGRGVGERENVARIEALAERLGVTLAASRPLVDVGWLPKPRQVGQSGVTVKPKLYLALGISGSVQHVAGMKGSGTIVAVNKDPEAPIFGVAHYGAVADLFDVVEELEKVL